MPRQLSRDQAKEVFWRKAIARQSASGLTKAEFCRREHLKPDMLAWWKRTIAERDAAVAVANCKAVRQEEQFVPLTIATETPTSTKPVEPSDDEVREILRAARRTPIAEISLHDVSIKLWRGADPETLRMVLQVLKETKLC